MSTKTTPAAPKQEKASKGASPLSSVSPPKQAILDADIFCYQACAAVEEETDWGNDLWSLTSDLSEAQQIFDHEVSKIKKTLGVEKIVLAFSHAVNFRSRVLPSYKQHRRGTRKPLAYPALRAYAGEIYNTLCCANLEGDDLLGLSASDMNNPYIAVSIDKDLKTVPGWHYNNQKDSQLRYVTVEEANKAHALQTLTGDRTDGYTGCPGVGPVKAESLLEGLEQGEYWCAITAAYMKAGLNEEEALKQARVAFILRAKHYNYKTGQVRLFDPKDWE